MRGQLGTGQRRLRQAFSPPGEQGGRATGIQRRRRVQQWEVPLKEPCRGTGAETSAASLQLEKRALGVCVCVALHNSGEIGATTERDS